MKRNICCFFLFAFFYSSTAVCASSFVERVGRIYTVWSSYKNLCANSAQYDEKYGNIVRIFCSQCNKRSVSVGEFFGALVGKIIQDLIAGNDSYKELYPLLDKALHLMQEEQIDELHEFVLNHLRDINYLCSYCRSFAWVLYV